MKTTVTLASIFRSAFPEYLQTYGRQPYEHYRVANAIMNCRTPRLGARAYECSECHHEQVHYHSCRNRHCPHCQGYRNLQWTQRRVEEMLPVGYFHAVFTLPPALNEFFLRNKRELYTILFRCVSETLLHLARDPKRLGANIGFIAIAHTWGQNLMDHPHIHCIVPAGGVKTDAPAWKHCREQFLFPVPVVRQLYKGKFMAAFKEALADHTIALHGKLQRFADPALLKELVDSLYEQDWVVHIKAPFASPQHVIRYLSNYVHRIAISERRLIRFDGHRVSFAYIDYADNNKRKVMTLPAVEFIRRFLLHVVPHQFTRIRHYGFFANKDRTEHINLCRKLLSERALLRVEQTWYETILDMLGHHPLLCPECNNGILRPRDKSPTQPGRIALKT